MSFFSLVLFFSVFAFATAQTTSWTVSPFNPPSLPLAVRSPYLNAWRPQGAGPQSVSVAWTYLWQTQSILGWYGAVQVDGTTYQVLGSANIAGTQIATQQAVEFTATRTSFLLQAGPVNVNMTFLSPIEPTDLVRQSIPFSYMYMTFASNDTTAHNVQVYSDISAEWVSGDDSLTVNWSSNTDGNAIILKTQLADPTPFAEIAEHAQDAVAYYSMNKQSGQTWQIGQDIILRSGFNVTGVLNNTVDPTFRAVSTDWPVFGISVDLGSITSTTSPVVWAIGLIRDPCIQALTSTGQIEDRSSYFWSNYSSDTDVVQAFLSDFDRALGAATDLDTQLQNNATQFSAEYADLVALAARQVLGSLDITLSKDGNGNWNTSDVKVFMKNFDPVGGSGGVNAVDVMFSAFPTFITLSPDLGKYLLVPLLEYQSSSSYSGGTYAIHDLGASYPNATAGDNNVANLGIEESANMLIMGLAHAQTSGDESLITTYYNLFKQWADYLVDNTLSPTNQFTSDELPAANQTNLAIKGIIGIRAMSRISEYIGNNDDISHYQNVSSTYLTQWQSLALSSDNSHILGEYNEQSSSALIYNLYADKLLQLGLVPDSVYESQTSFYAQQIEGLGYGIPYDSSEVQTRSDWMLLTAATVTQALTRNSFVSFVHDYASSFKNNTPLALEYNPLTAFSPAKSAVGINSPAQGSVFSLLALNVPLQNVSSGAGGSGNGGGGGSSGSSTDIGAIVGGVLGALAVIGVIIALVLFFRRRRRRSMTYDTSVNAFPQLADPEIAAKDNVLSSGMTYEPFSVMLHEGTESTATQTQAQPQSPGRYPFASTPYSFVGSSNVASLGHQRTTSDATTVPLSPSLYPPTTSDVGLSASRIFAAAPSEVTSSVSSGDRDRTSTSRSQVLMAKQTLVNEELRSEVDNLRREMERIREERTDVIVRQDLEEAPPSYFVA